MPCRSTSRVVVSGGQCECATSFEVTTDRRRVASVRRGLLIDLRRLFMIVPPGLRDATCVAWFCRWSAEHVPIGEPVRSLVPVRNPIAARADHSVEYPAGHRQARAAIGCDDLVDERIYDWIGNAGEILRALHCGGLRGKITTQRVAGRARKGESLNREVEVEIIDPFAILYRVNNAQSRLDAQRPEILDERHVMRLKRRLVYQEFDADWLTLRGPGQKWWLGPHPFADQMNVMTSSDNLTLILRRLDEIERKLDRIMEELRTPTAIGYSVRRGNFPTKD
jgi:hypothetical protein